MDSYISGSAISFLQTLNNQQLCYGMKSPDTDLYDFGFGEFVEFVSRDRNTRELCTSVLHVTCRFKVIWRNKKRRILRFYEDTSHIKFHSEIQHLIGLRIQRVALSSKNDLWLDLGDCWIVFATFENGEESWRLFTLKEESPHLIASNSALVFS